MIHLALIGVGHWGKNYLGIVSGMNICKITHICTKTRKTLFRYPNNYHKTIDYTQLLTGGNIDGAIIATPAASHFTIAKDFISAGIPVLVEKPLTSTLRETVALEKLVRSKKTIVMVGHEYLYNPAYLKLKEVLPSLGSIHSIETEAGNWWPFHTDVSMLWNWGPHDVSMLIDLAETLPRSILAWGIPKKKENGVVDTVYAKLDFAEFSAVIKLSRILPAKKRNMLIIGEKGSISYNELAKNKLELFTHETGKTYYPRHSNISPLEKEITVFVKAIKTQKEPVTRINHAVLVARVLDAIDQSLNGEKIIRLV